ncbi:MAG: helix-turn-helix transcriptional regulator [Rhodospirillales bacterium]
MVNQDELKKSKKRALRKEGGKYLTRLRKDAGLTQRELAEKIGLEYYTFISQVESGQGRLQASLYESAATAFGIEPKEFVKNMLMYYEPDTYDALFRRSGGQKDGAQKQVK